ncbi:hypothetical protein WA1_51100 [Scytonema hofmannii PCC 7110]|uniref:Uncharacterized protein n=1 Tax=Scytonema hofmannii PCC 7110 TaxID=128403 RepID=A0A139WQ50_9CYAN|nr:hypothetical protein [Scytonema hofmannii]KYC34554.1 hypothetical protein WA1_51100 [Scytonema hofmannii PCC 7110]
MLVTSDLISTINDLLFPVLLFVLSFCTFCYFYSPESFENCVQSHDANCVDKTLQDLAQLADLEAPVATEPPTFISDSIEISTLELETKSVWEESTVPTVGAEQTKTVVLVDVGREKQLLTELGARKLRSFCKERKLKGYSVVYNKHSLDGLVDFLLARGFTYSQIVVDVA